MVDCLVRVMTVRCLSYLSYLLVGGRQVLNTSDSGDGVDVKGYPLEGHPLADGWFQRFQIILGMRGCTLCARGYKGG